MAPCASGHSTSGAVKSRHPAAYAQPDPDPRREAAW